MDFKKALQTIDTNFESILEIMKLRNEPEQVNSVRNLLLTANLILDYFMNREGEELKIAVAYFPVCSEFAQELCEDFVALKLGLYTNREWKNFLCNSLCRQEINANGIKTKKQQSELRENHRFENQLSNILCRSRNEYTDYGTTLMYSENLIKKQKSYCEANKTYNRKSVNKYWYLRHAINDNKDFLDGSSPLSLVQGDPDYFYDHVLENERGKQIRNIVVFPTKSADGRYTIFVQTLSKNLILMTS